jgi:mRNA interferase HicA
MISKELIKRLQKLSKERKVSVRVESKRGKGSHVTLYFGANFVVIPDLK